MLSEVLTAASEADVLVLGRSGSSLLRRGRLGSTVRGLLPKQFGLALIVHERQSVRTPLAIVYDGSDIADRALRAADLMNAHADENQTLIVILLAQNVEKARQLQDQAISLLANRDVTIRFRWLTSTNVLRLADILVAEGCGTLVLPARSVTLENDLLIIILEKLLLPLLLVT